jgi:coenzyme F420-reducing hydrogenase beta subunit
MNNLIKVVENGYCIGCGICVGLCDSEKSKMTINRFGFYEPQFASECLNCNDCNFVCPFGSGIVDINENNNETSIFQQTHNISEYNNNNYIGYYHHCYVGYSPTYRLSSSSGGIATWLLIHMLNNKIIDKAICVKPTLSSNTFFEYSICSDIETVISSSKSHYYPVHLANIIKQVLKDNQKYAIVGLPCFIKGLRLAQIKNKILSERIIFTVGLFCGGLKSSFFTEYLAAKIGIEKQNILNPIYRLKRENSTNQGYFFGCKDLNNPTQTVELNVKKLGDLWGPGYFKHNACDYCDDVTAELSDISLGDAWIQPYQNDWKGHSIIITRSKIAEDLINDGIINNEIILENITVNKIIKSQQSNFNHRRKGLSYRLYWQKNKITPMKRIKPERPKNIIIACIYRLKLLIREKSLLVWSETPSNKSRVTYFNRKLFLYILFLRSLNFLNKYMIRIFRLR